MSSALCQCAGPHASPLVRLDAARTGTGLPLLLPHSSSTQAPSCTHAPLRADVRFRCLGGAPQREAVLAALHRAVPIADCGGHCAGECPVVAGRRCCSAAWRQWLGPSAVPRGRLYGQQALLMLTQTPATPLFLPQPILLVFLEATGVCWYETALRSGMLPATWRSIQGGQGPLPIVA